MKGGGDCACETQSNGANFLQPLVSVLYNGWSFIVYSDVSGQHRDAIMVMLKFKHSITSQIIL